MMMTSLDDRDILKQFQIGSSVASRETSHLPNNNRQMLHNLPLRNAIKITNDYTMELLTEGAAITYGRHWCLHDVLAGMVEPVPGLELVAGDGGRCHRVTGHRRGDHSRVQAARCGQSSYILT